MIQKCLYLSSLAEWEIFPAQVSNDSSCQGVAKNVDHGPEPVAMEMEVRNWGSSAHFKEQFQSEDGKVWMRIRAITEAIILIYVWLLGTNII